MDKVSQEKRSEIMSSVHNKETGLEILVKKELWCLGARYRKNDNRYFGKPDLIFSGKKTVVFIDSCFWHGCPKHLRLPATNKNYWSKKIDRNRRRDSAVQKYYVESGWKIFRIWEHDLKDSVKRMRKIHRIMSSLNTKYP